MSRFYCLFFWRLCYLFPSVHTHSQMKLQIIGNNEPQVAVWSYVWILFVKSVSCYNTELTHSCNSRCYSLIQFCLWSWHFTDGIRRFFIWRHTYRRSRAAGVLKFKLCSEAGRVVIAYHVWVKCQDLFVCCSVDQTHTHTYTSLSPLCPKTTLNYSSSFLQSCASNSSFTEFTERHSIITLRFPSQWASPSARCR